MLRFPADSPTAERDLQMREDVRLLVAMAEGDQRSVTGLYQRRAGLLYSLLVRMLGNEMEAQDCMQDVFLAIWRRAGEFDSDRSSPIAWMVMIARGKAVDRLRAQGRRESYEQACVSLDLEFNQTPEIDREELSEACAAALNQLPAPQGKAVQLAFLRGWTHEEIARAQGEPIGTIKARIRRGLLTLRKFLKEYHD